MKQDNFNCSITVNTTPSKAIENINNVGAWWVENMEGNAEKLNNVFTVHFGETFVDFKVVESIAAEGIIVWLVTDCNLHWLSDKKEWNGTKILWEISGNNNSTHINFTHIGLVPAIECYENCKKGWTFFITESLFKLITTGKGIPEPKKELV